MNAPGIGKMNMLDLGARFEVNAHKVTFFAPNIGKVPPS